LGDLILLFPGSNPGAPAKSQRAEFFAETALFSRDFLGAFGNGFRPPFGNSVPLCSSNWWRSREVDDRRVGSREGKVGNTKWGNCEQQATDQKLTGRQSWIFIYKCMF
jgi:hypothetical protein